MQDKLLFYDRCVTERREAEADGDHDVEEDGAERESAAKEALHMAKQELRRPRVVSFL